MKAIVIAMSGLHLGYLGCYGNEWIGTPAFDQLAAEGLVCDRHYADCPDPDAARCTWRDGRHRLPLPTGPAPETPATDLLALLHGRGVATWLLADPARPAAAPFSTGWDQVVVPAYDPAEETPLDALRQGLAEAMRALRRTEHGLLWIEVNSLLPPWDVPPELCAEYLVDDMADTEDDAVLPPLLDPAPGRIDRADTATYLRLQGSYAGAVTLADAWLGDVLELLRKRGLRDEVLLVLTTDRGLALGEHGVVGDAEPWLHEELVHLPLLVRLPGGAEAGRRVAALTSAVDLQPTLLDHFGLPAAEAQGHSLLPLLRGASGEVRPYACSGLRRAGRVEWSLRTQEWAYLLPLDDETRRPQLYRKPEDRWEVNNLLQHHLDLAEHLERTLRGFVEAIPRPGPFTPPPLPDQDQPADAAPPAAPSPPEAPA